MKTQKEIGAQLQRIRSSFKKTINYHDDRLPNGSNEKIIILGNIYVGKTAFVSQITGNPDFPEFYRPSDSLIITPHDFSIQDHRGEYSLILQTKINLYEIAGSISKEIDFSNIFSNVKLFLIFISATDAAESKAQQIAEWLHFIEKNSKNANNQILLVENKIDVEKSRPLSSQFIERFNNRFVGYKTMSAKNKTSLLELEEMIIKAIDPMHPRLNADKEEWLKNITIDPSKSKLINSDIALGNLSDEQANIILKSMERLLHNGTTRLPTKAFNLSLFGGGVLRNVVAKQKVPTYISNMHQIIDYKDALESHSIAHAKLKLILHESIIAANHDHFTRRQNTQMFYEEVIPTFIERVISKDNLDILKNINELTVDQARSLLALLKSKLLIGTEQNIKSPYKLGFLGGVIYEEDKLKIKVPHHVSLWLIKLKEINESSNHKLILQELFHDILAAGSSYNSSRSNVTQNFYQAVLPRWLKDNLTPNSLPENLLPLQASLACM